jgi:5,5'-dehydrodivanillate O-demethylase oxygenase subunit
MLTREANERLTRVGPGTPGGNLLRRYWWPIATYAEVTKDPVLPVKLLGENLALYRSPNGELGITAERCPHRGASLVYGIPENGGLRCPYHGWKFSPDGACLEQPAEPENSTFKHRVRIPAYPVQEMGGLIWTYLGPAPVPLLPRFDLFVHPQVERDIGITILPCNWLQAMENSLDSHHLEWLHMYYTNYVLQRKGSADRLPVRHHMKAEYDIFEYGISKRRLWEGEAEENNDEWNIGHPIIFPHTLAVGASNTNPQFQIRVPMDDVTTLHYWYMCKPLPTGSAPQPIEDIKVWDNPYKHPDGKFTVDTVNGQDMMVWITQGAISARETERLGSSDKGVILYRSLIMSEIEKVENGHDPMGTVRDPAKNEPWISLPREGALGYNVRSQDVPAAVKQEYGKV